MLSSTAHQDSSSSKNINNTNNTKSLNRLSSTSSKSSSVSSSPSPFPPSNLLTHKHKTMEEVWKDINLASLNDNPSTGQDFSVTPRLDDPNRNPNFILQDFFARPFSKDPLIVSTRSDSTLYSSPLPPPATVLSLNSGPGLDFLDNSDPLRACSHLQTNPISTISSFNSPLAALASSSGSSLSGKKRVQDFDRGPSDSRHKRMIKNRESAARSRARRQAYTTELELEVAHLTEENARLKRQQEELCLAAAAQLPKRYTLHRTSTAPF